MLVAVLMISGMISGCAQNHFNVPIDNFAEKVKVLGVIPIIVDADSDIIHPQKEQLTQIVTDMNRKYEQQLVSKLKGTGNFFTVALMDGDPKSIFGDLLSRREKRDDAAILYNKYFLKNNELRNYIKRNNLDAVMLIVVSGLTKSDRVYSGNLLSSLTGDYNFLTMTAQILDANGVLLWEYPNFRSREPAYCPMINLQYPDFSEADANLSGKAQMKFRTLDGIQRSLDKKKKDLLFRQTQESEIYAKQFDEMLSLLKYDSGAGKKVSAPATTQPPATGMQPRGAEPSAAASGVKPTVAPVPPTPVESPKSAIQPVEITKPPEVGAPKPPENIIVPATGSTL
jgi:hypothetical protein